MRRNNVRLEIPKSCLTMLNEFEASESDSPPPPPQSVRIGRLVHSVKALNAITASLPAAYGWRFITADNFTKLYEARARGGASIAELNTLYWRDMLATIEANTVMSVWRMVDICQSAFRCIEEDAIVASAILARSALESSVQFVQDARTFAASLEQVMQADLRANIGHSSELEQYLLQTVYASKQADADEIYRPKNILTVLRNIAKIAKDEPLEEQYEILCEVTHPNFLGRSIYVAGAEADPSTGSELRTISPQNGLATERLLRSILWTLSWAIEAQATSTHLVQGAVRDFVGILPPKSSSLN